MGLKIVQDFANLAILAQRAEQFCCRFHAVPGYGSRFRDMLSGRRTTLDQELVDMLASSGLSQGDRYGSVVDDFRSMARVMSVAERIDALYDIEFQPVAEGVPVATDDALTALKQWRASTRGLDCVVERPGDLLG